MKINRQTSIRQTAVTHVCRYKMSRTRRKSNLPRVRSPSRMISAHNGERRLLAGRLRESEKKFIETHVNPSRQYKIITACMQCSEYYTKQIPREWTHRKRINRIFASPRRGLPNSRAVFYYYPRTYTTYICSIWTYYYYESAAYLLVYCAWTVYIYTPTDCGILPEMYVTHKTQTVRNSNNMIYYYYKYNISIPLRYSRIVVQIDTSLLNL